MTPPLRFCFGLHLHQPIGNFDTVFRDHVDTVYAPLLRGLEDGQTWPVTIHVSGPLLDWLEREASNWVDQLGRHAVDGRIELLAAGHDEPILAALSAVDRVEQVVRHRERLWQRFGVDTGGLWLTERVWEGDLPRDLVRAGIRFVVVDDRHLRVTGVARDELHRPWITEYDGDTLTVLAIDQRLRYLVPFRPVDELEDYLTTLRAGGHRLAMLADDGEKLGGWPGTAKWVWQDGWFADFSARMRSLRESGTVILSTMSDAIAAIPARGPVYLPSASYHEMERWALPPVQARRLALLEAAPLQQEPGVDDEALLRGTHWRNFLSKYPESNRLHKVMQHLSRRCHAAGDPAEVRHHIGRAQCNDAYWHGVFGGIYLPFLRGTLWHELAAAARLLHHDQPLGIESLDIDGDGHDEVLVTSPAFLAVVAPHRGGAVEVLLDLALGVNLADTMTRHEEAYHPSGDLDSTDIPLIEPDGSDGTASIHDNETSVEERPPLDTVPRALLVDRFVAPSCSAEDFCNGTPPVVREIASTALVAITRLDADRAIIECEGPGFRKLLCFDLVGHLTVEWEWNTPDAGLSHGINFTTELSLAASVAIDADGATRWDYPIETVARSERGFDRTLQGQAVVLSWPSSDGLARVVLRR